MTKSGARSGVESSLKALEAVRPAPVTIIMSATEGQYHRERGPRTAERGPTSSGMEINMSRRPPMAAALGRSPKKTMAESVGTTTVSRSTMKVTPTPERTSSR